jgi:quercetin dioxygenase-like cupin family protein
MRAAVGAVAISFLAGMGVMALAQVAQAPPAAGAVELKQIQVMDLGAELPGMEGMKFRMRTVTFPPGSRTPEHNHKGRPGLVYVLQGTFTEHRNGVATQYGPGSSWIEDHDTTHWAENLGATPAVQLSVAIDDQP